MGRIIIKPNNGNEILAPVANMTPIIQHTADEEMQELCNNSLQRLSLMKHKSIESKFIKWSCMDRKIMKKVKNVIDDQFEKLSAKQEKQTQENRLKAIEIQLKLLTDMLLDKK